MKQNCWEFKKCGREPGGAKVQELGACPAATTADYTGANSGKNGGRLCWKVSGTYCKGEVQGSFASKYANCVMCDFFTLVKQEEGGAFRKV
ncbi:MAG: hypothetical protein WCX65_10515 [bacterium]